MKTTTLPVSALEVCDRTRVRHQKPKDGTDIVQEYAEAYQCGLILEPLDVFREKGTERYIVADGEHRLLALRRAKIKQIDCRLHEGDEIAALDFAIGCNQAHGVRRTERDRYHALARIMETSLRDKYRTDTELSEKLGVSIATVKRYKAQWRNSDGGDERTQEKKGKARARAEKHTSQPKANGSREPFHASDSSREIPAPTGTEPKNEPVQLVQHPEQHKPVSIFVPPEKAHVSNPSDAELITDFTDAMLLFEELPPAGEFRGLLNGQLNWDHVERAHQWLTDLLAER
jgi:hypothetical protein